MLKNLLIIISLFIFSSCSGKIENYNFAQKSLNKTISIIKPELKLDLAVDEKFCTYGFLDESKNYITPIYSDDNKYLLIETKGEGKVYLSEVKCYVKKDGANYERTFPFNNLYFEAKQNQINYAGSLEISWKPKDINIISALKNFTIPTNNSGYLSIENSNKLDGVKAYLANKNNSLPINFTPLNKDGLKRFGSKK